MLRLLDGDVSFEHSVVLEGPNVLRAIFESEDAATMLEVFFPFSFILAAVGVIESTLAMSLAKHPVADVPVSQQLALCGAVQPDVGAESALEVVFPVAFVLFGAGLPVHAALTVSLVVGPLTLVVVSAGVGHGSVAPFHSSLPLSFVDRPVLVNELSFAMSHTIEPLADVFDTFLGVDVFALAVSETVLDLALVSGAVGPLVTADASDLVAFEFTLVLGSVSPIETALTMQESVLELTFILMAVSELACALTVVDLANLKEKKNNVLMDHRFRQKYG